MKAAASPRVQLFVCTNVRAGDDPLTSLCGQHGPAVYDALKRAVNASGAVRSVWVTRTACLGHCPKEGCSVAIYPQNEHRSDVTVRDVPALLAVAVEKR